MKCGKATKVMNIWAIFFIFSTNSILNHLVKKNFPGFFRIPENPMSRSRKFSALRNLGVNHIHYVLFSQFWSHYHGTMHCLPQRLEIFSNGAVLKGPAEWEKISNNVDFSLWGYRATTWAYFVTFSSETKITKITHSA